MMRELLGAGHHGVQVRLIWTISFKLVFNSFPCSPPCSSGPLRDSVRPKIAVGSAARFTKELKAQAFRPSPEWFWRVIFGGNSR
jgi:hypothetical protein